jgi:hypothetical protein
MDCEVEQFVSLLQLRIWGRKIVKLRSTQINPEVVAARDIPSGVDDMTQVGTAIHLVRNAVGRNDGKRDTVGCDACRQGHLLSSLNFFEKSTRARGRV